MFSIKVSRVWSCKVVSVWKKGDTTEYDEHQPKSRPVKLSLIVQTTKYFLNDQVYFYCLPNLYIYLWPEKLQNHVTSLNFSEITMENDWWLLILRNHSQWKIVQWSGRSWQSCIPVKKRFITFFFFSKLVCRFKQKRNNFKVSKHPQKQVKIHQIKNWLRCFHLHP